MKLNLPPQYALIHRVWMEPPGSPANSMPRCPFARRSHVGSQVLPHLSPNPKPRRRNCPEVIDGLCDLSSGRRQSRSNVPR